MENVSITQQKKQLITALQTEVFRAIIMRSKSESALPEIFHKLRIQAKKLAIIFLLKDFRKCNYQLNYKLIN